MTTKTSDIKGEDPSIFDVQDDSSDSSLRSRREFRRLHASDYGEDCGYIPAQFEKMTKAVPTRGIALALVLTFCGFVTLFTCVYQVWRAGGYWSEKEFVLLILAIIMSVPGTYNVYLTIKAYFGHPGYSYEDIPDFD